MGNLLGAPITEKHTKGGETTDGLSYGLSSMQGWRIHMEDAHICATELYAEYEDKADQTQTNNEVKRILVPQTSLFAVFDGHAGSFAAEFAEENFVKVLAREPKFVEYAQIMEKNTENNILEQKETEEQIATRDREQLQLLEDALTSAFLEFDKVLFSTISSSPPIDENNNDVEFEHNEDHVNYNDDSGTTSVVVLLTPRWIICANAGDSRAIYSKASGRAIPLSYDHKPDDEDEERRIREAGGCVRAGRVDGDLAVSRGFGDFRFKSNPHKNQVEQRVSPLPDIIVQTRDNNNDEFIVLACDGVWDVATNKECTNMVHEIFQEGEKDMSLVCEEMLDLCLRRGSKDNISFLLIQLPALKFGTGGGVTARREKLLAELKAMQQQEEDEQENPEYLPRTMRGFGGVN